METKDQNSRRSFLTNALKSAVIIGAGASVASTILNPLDAIAQTPPLALQSKIAALGSTSLKSSKLALTKGANAEVKMFAKFEAAEQETMGKILKDMGTPVTVENKEAKDILAKLTKLTGSAFDKAFMQAQVDTHIKLKAAVSALMTATADKHTKHITSLALVTIQEHIERGTLLLNKLA
jgi:putative membrane protein